MRNSYRKTLVQTETVLVSTLMLFATTAISFGQQSVLSPPRDYHGQFLQESHGPGLVAERISAAAQKEIPKTGRNEIEEPKMDALELLTGFFDGKFDDVEKNDIEAIAKLRRELILLDLERQKAVLENEINQLANGRDQENSSHYEELLAEVELLKERMNKSENQGRDFAGEIALPTVVEISGSLEEMEALLHVPRSGIVTARGGTLLPNGIVVDSVNYEGVTVRSGSAYYLLSLGGNIPERLAASNPEASAGNPNN